MIDTKFISTSVTRRMRNVYYYVYGIFISHGCRPFCFLLFFPDQNNKRIVLALQSGLKSELGWAINALTLLSFKEKDDVRKDATPLAKIPGLLDALLQVVCASFFPSSIDFDHLYSKITLSSFP